jgi:hypothetical protein
MMNAMMIWRRNKQTAGMDAILEGESFHLAKYKRRPTAISLPVGFLSDSEIAQLRVRFKVTVDAPQYFKNEIWFGMDEVKA